ncbi:hypothetical protein SKAU_G00281100 [Synaphobranchus kaupii]|uniref:Uncharacterized protein n=1 Tax=Synaphobranchus kaupii TaxID=118154 RepID=A0A9Q1EXB2_SYNKA|nr:hypothetical protein SKAU_G00281100 [Synaphobranchus kaupii]
MSRGRKSVHYDSASPPRRSRDESRHKSISPPRRRLDMRRRDSTSPFSRNLSVSRRHSASRSQSRADTYRGTYSSRRQYTLSPPRRNRYGARAHTHPTWLVEESSSSESDYESNKLRSWGPRHNDGPRFKHLDSIAKDIERFDPEKLNHNVEDYLRELEHCLLDLPGATRQKRLKLIWKMTSRSVQAFIESQPPLVRDSFSRLSRALIEEFSPFANETSATISALQIKHRRSEALKEFYNRRLRVDACNLHITSYTQDQAPITQRAWLEVAFQEMKILHPVYISRFDTESFLIGQDLLDRLTPLIDCHCGQLWAQVVAPKSIEMETDARNLCEAVAVSQGPIIKPHSPLFPSRESFPSSSSSPDPDNPQIEDHNPWPPAHILQDHKAFLCTLGDSGATLYSPRITGGIQANGVAVQEVIVALWSETSAVRQDLCDIIRQNNANLPFVQKSHRLLSAELPQAPVKSIGVCALTLQIGGREFVHYVSVAPLLSHSFYIGADILVRLGAQLDMINQVVWSQANIGRNKLTAQPEQMCSGQTVPLACQVASEFDVVIPSRTTGVPLRLMILRGQELDSTQTFFQHSPHLFELNLMVCGSPLLEVTNRSVYLLVQNLTHRAIQVTAHKPLGYLIYSSYHNFELTIPIIGQLPNSLREFGNGEGVYLTHPTNMITIFPQEPIQSSTVCHVDLGDKVGMVLHTSTSSDPISCL